MNYGNYGLSSPYGNPYQSANPYLSNTMMNSPYAHQQLPLQQQLAAQSPTSSQTPTQQTSASSSGLNPALMREDMVQSAIRFLQHRDSLRVPSLERVRFLEDKGLASAEIAEAFARCMPAAPETALLSSAAQQGVLASDALANPSASPAPAPAAFFEGGNEAPTAAEPLPPSHSTPLGSPAPPQQLPGAPPTASPAGRAVAHIHHAHGPARASWLSSLFSAPVLAASVAAAAYGVYSWHRGRAAAPAPAAACAEDEYERDIAFLKAHAAQPLLEHTQTSGAVESSSPAPAAAPPSPAPPAADLSVLVGPDPAVRSLAEVTALRGAVTSLQGEVEALHRALGEVKAVVEASHVSSTAFADEWRARQPLLAEKADVEALAQTRPAASLPVNPWGDPRRSDSDSERGYSPERPASESAWGEGGGYSLALHAPLPTPAVDGAAEEAAATEIGRVDSVEAAADAAEATSPITPSPAETPTDVSAEAASPAAPSEAPAASEDASPAASPATVETILAAALLPWRHRQARALQRALARYRGEAYVLEPLAHAPADDGAATATPDEDLPAASPRPFVPRAFPRAQATPAEAPYAGADAWGYMATARAASDAPLRSLRTLAMYLRNAAKSPRVPAYRQVLRARPVVKLALATPGAEELVSAAGFVDKPDKFELVLPAAEAPGETGACAGVVLPPPLLGDPSLAAGLRRCEELGLGDQARSTAVRVLIDALTATVAAAADAALALANEISSGAPAADPVAQFFAACPEADADALAAAEDACASTAAEPQGESPEPSLVQMHAQHAANALSSAVFGEAADSSGPPSSPAAGYYVDLPAGMLSPTPATAVSHAQAAAQPSPAADPTDASSAASPAAPVANADAPAPTSASSPLPILINPVPFAVDPAALSQASAQDSRAPPFAETAINTDDSFLQLAHPVPAASPEAAPSGSHTPRVTVAQLHAVRSRQNTPAHTPAQSRGPTPQQTPELSPRGAPKGTPKRKK